MTRIVRSCSLSTFLFVIDRRTRDHGHKRGRRSRYRMVVGFINPTCLLMASPVFSRGLSNMVPLWQRIDICSPVVFIPTM